LYNKGGGYNLGYNKGPVNVSYTSNPGLGNNVMLRGQYNFADGGVASMFRKRPRYQEGGSAGLVFNPGPYEGPYEGPYILGGPIPGQYYQSSPITSITGPDGAIPRPGMPMISSPSTQTLQPDYLSNPIYQNFINSPFYQTGAGTTAMTPVTLPSGEILMLPGSFSANQFKEYLASTPAGGLPVTTMPVTGPIPTPFTPTPGLTAPIVETPISVAEQVQKFAMQGTPAVNEEFIINRRRQAEQDAAARVTPRMAYGGRVSMSDGGLTTTVPPDKGPDSQGVESLFRRRYN